LCPASLQRSGGTDWPVCALRGATVIQPNKQVRNLRFHLTVRGQVLAVENTTDGATYNLEQGDGLTVYHREERLDLRPGEPVRRP
jgi:alpha,alpha-trehalose phosphorylase